MKSPFEGAQWAEWVGFRGLSLLTWFANGSFAWLWLRSEARREASFLGRAGGLAVPLAILLLIDLGGYLTRPKQDGALRRVLIVQANIGNPEKLNARSFHEVRGPILERHLKLTREGFNRAAEKSESPDFVVWPETAIPARFDPQFLYEHYQQTTLAVANEISRPIVFGAYSQNIGERSEYNAVFHANRQGHVLENYRKTKLLAFGETFPGADLFPVLRDWIPTISEFGRGTGPNVMNVEGIKLGVQICYEGLFPDFSRALVNLGAQVLLNVTNDSWFGKHFEPHQHFLMTAARAIEVRRPIIRATNTGISTVVQADGSFETLSPVQSEWTGTLKVWLNPPIMTTYQIWGAWLEPFAAITLLLLAFFNRTRS